MASTTPVPEPSPHTSVNASQAAVGVPVSPLRRLANMEEDEWEEFILEWFDSLRKHNTYTEVHRGGSKGDMGRDVNSRSPRSGVVMHGPVPSDAVRIRPNLAPPRLELILLTFGLWIRRSPFIVCTSRSR